MIEIFIDEPGAFLHAIELPIVPQIGDFVTYQNSSPNVETRRVVWRRIEGDTSNGSMRIVIGVEDRRPGSQRRSTGDDVDYLHFRPINPARVIEQG